MKLSALLIFAGALTARAAVTLSVTASVKNSARGATLTFSGTVTNDGAAEVCLNEAAFSFTGGAGAHLVPGTNVFFSSVPGILLPGESYTGELFEAALSGTAPAGDYAGMVTLKGGADQLTADTLATGNFAVLSPEVTAVATDVFASEYGPDAGTLTISRTGRTDISLPVSVTFSGSAGNGTTYQFVGPVVVIPAGAVSQDVSIVPIPDNLVQGDRQAALTVEPSAAYNTGAGPGASVTIHDKPADAWRLAHFGAGANTPAAADAADWNGDGIDNRMAYALGLDPAGFDLHSLPVASVSGGYYQLTWTPNPAAVDVTLTAEASTDLTTWSASEMEAVASAPGQSVYRYQVPAGQTPRVFLRLRATRNP
ncbi:MAG TPA: hypothetical protein VHM91_24670 [Verrucomicrobiales bacterium]|nr:hypothetical protein [Verrucomicrobiales bacterium]